MVQSSTQRNTSTRRKATQLVSIWAVSTKGLVTLPSVAAAPYAPSAVDSNAPSTPAAKVRPQFRARERVNGANPAASVMLVSQPAIATFTQPASKTQVQPLAPGWDSTLASSKFGSS